MPFFSAPRGALLVAEIENSMGTSRLKRHRTMVDLPDPEGAEKIMSLP